jgi:hypothetical protein
VVKKMDLLTALGAGTIPIALGAFLIFYKRKLLFAKNMERIIGIVVVVFGLSMSGYLAGLGGTSNDQTVNTYGALQKVTLHDGVVNCSGSTDTGNDFFTNSYLLDTQYVDDADVVDGEYICVNATLTRANAQEGATTTVTCTSPDFQKTGTNYNLVYKDTMSNLVGGIGNAYSSTSAVTFTGTTMSKNVGWSVGEQDKEIVIGFKQSESAEDILATKEQAPPIVCTAGGQTFVIQAVAND